MHVYNEQVVKLFNQYADLLEIANENPFRVRAYRNAARTLSGLSKNIFDLLQQGYDLQELPYIGKDLAEKIKTVVETGDFPELKKLTKRLPLFLTELMELEGLGPKRARMLYEELKIDNFEKLKQALEQEKLRKLKGFSEKLEEKIKESLKHKGEYGKRVKLIEAMTIAEPLVNYLKKLPGVITVEVAGSYRRRKETVGDLDILVAASENLNVEKYFEAYEEVQDVLASGKKRSTVRLHSGIQVDLRVIAPESMGAALIYFTGSKAHNIKLRQMAQEKGLKINEYGILKDNKIIAQKTESDIYRVMNFSYIEPELREDQGEFDAAFANKLPNLISLQDIRGDLHCHTQASDGANTLEQMVQTAQSLGYEYIAITDHSQHLTVAHGLDEKRILKQLEAIDELNTKLKKFTILKSIEVDILENGKLDFSDRILKELDITVCSVHSHFSLSRRKQTNRILRAMDNPYFKILGHPTGRVIGKRNAYQFDLEAIMIHAKDKSCFLEINAQPERLDLNENYCRLAKALGIKLAISTDAHNTQQLTTLMQFGIYQARRGWLEKSDVINTLSLVKLKKLLSLI